MVPTVTAGDLQSRNLPIPLFLHHPSFKVLTSSHRFKVVKCAGLREFREILSLNQVRELISMVNRLDHVLMF